jgi:hypothetical protein
LASFDLLECLVGRVGDLDYVAGDSGDPMSVLGAGGEPGADFDGLDVDESSGSSRSSSSCAAAAGTIAAAR